MSPVRDLRAAFAPPAVTAVKGSGPSTPRRPAIAYLPQAPPLSGGETGIPSRTRALAKGFKKNLLISPPESGAWAVALSKIGSGIRRDCACWCGAAPPAGPRRETAPRRRCARPNRPTTPPAAGPPRPGRRHCSSRLCELSPASVVSRRDALGDSHESFAHSG